MSTSVEEQALKERLKELDRRLRARRRELRVRGWFAAAHDVVVADIRQHQAEILQALSRELARGGVSWSLLRTEFALELNGLADTLVSWQERLDAGMVKEGSGEQRPV